MANKRETSGSLNGEELKSLLQELKDLKDQLVININVEKVELMIQDIQELPLHLNFEKVEVKENKGNINFGNNFGLSNEETKDMEKKQSETHENIKIKVNNREIDYYK
ncbi:hypothetical protein [Bacillus sp. AK128]